MEKRKNAPVDHDEESGSNKKRKDTNGKPTKGKSKGLPNGLQMIRGLPPSMLAAQQATQAPAPPPAPAKPPSPLPSTPINPFGSRSRSPSRPIRPAPANIYAVAGLDSYPAPIGMNKEEAVVDEEARRIQHEFGELKGKQRAELSASTSKALAPPSTTRPKAKKSLAPSKTTMAPPPAPLLAPSRTFHSAIHPPAGPVTPPRAYHSDILQSLPVRETPLIAKNKAMRKGLTSASDSSRRSSFGQRGKRASESLGNGVLSQPHSSVPTSIFYKHITPDLPDAHRMRHLLVWLASRATTNPSHSLAVQREIPSLSLSAGDALPRLTAAGQRLKREVQDELMSMLAEPGKVDTRINGVIEPERTVGGYIKENEQNSKNRRREDDFMREVETCKAEEAAWRSTRDFYNTLQAQALTSSKANKGKARAGTPSKSSRIAAGIDVSLLDEDLAHGLEDVLDDARAHEKRRFDRSQDADIELMVDRLHAAMHRSATLTEQASSTLDVLFKALSARMQAAPGLLTSHSLPSAGASSSSNLLSTAGENPNKAKAVREPMDLMRALARTDAAHPRRDHRSPAPSMALRSGAGKRRKDGEDEGESRRERRVTAVGSNTAALRTPRRTVPGTPRKKGG